MTPADACNALRVIQWLDDKRWGKGRIRDPKDPSSPPANPEIDVLTHWLTYITERQMPAKDIWEKGWPVFESWVRAYYKASGPMLSNLDKHFSPQKVDGEIKWRFREIGGAESFASRYPSKDYKCIKRTLQILERRYHSRFSKFMLERINAVGPGPSGTIHRLAASLFLLTYDHDESVEGALRIFENPGRFENYFMAWEKKATEGKKRLWASLRDFVKEGAGPREDFIAMLESSDHKAAVFWKDISSSFDYLIQLELPGDVWNDNATFRENLLNPIAIALGLPTASMHVSDLARKICEAANNLDHSLNVYPEQFDVTYSFVPRMCDHERNTTGTYCREFCPFGQNGATKLYSKDSEMNMVALVLASFLTRRKENDDIILKELGKGTCKMIGSATTEAARS